MKLRASVLFLLIAASIVTIHIDLVRAQADRREAIAVPVAGRDLVLAEMRTMLSSVEGIVAGLAQKDMQRVAAAARASGMATAADLAPGVQERLPMEFKQLGMSVHKGFDALATAVEDGAPVESVLTRLAGQLSACVACHERYRLTIGKGQ